jgi:hypothetical protein
LWHIIRHIRAVDTNWSVMNTCVALVGAYLRFNGYVTVPEQPVLVGEGKPYRYHTATDVDILAVRFPNAAVVVPRASGTIDDDLHLDVDPALELEKNTVDVLVGEVKAGRPRLNEGLRDPSVLYATLPRVDPGFDNPLTETIEKLIRHGEARCNSAGKRWRFRLVAFGEGQASPEGGPFTVIQLRHVAGFIMQQLREHHVVWKDAQFGDSVLDLMHLFDKMGFEWRLVRDSQTAMEPTMEETTALPLPAAHKNGKPATKPATVKKTSAAKSAKTVAPVRNVKPRKGAAAAARSRSDRKAN